jgi:response regulator RpfG family c-di-GMP phosphodiesterase
VHAGNVQVVRTILLIDDDLASRASHARSLGNHLTVREVGADDVASVIEKERFDLVVVDNALRSEDPFALLARVQRASPETRRLLMTTAAQVPNLESHLTSGLVEGLLFKPFAMENFLSQLDSLECTCAPDHASNEGDALTIRVPGASLGPSVSDVVTRGAVKKSIAK